MANFNVTFRDHSDELSTVSLPIAEPAGDGSDYASILADMGDIITALNALSIGSIIRHSLTVAQTETGDGRPSNEYAQRESGLRLFWEADPATATNYAKGHVTIPMPDLNLVASPGTDLVDISGVTVVNALIALLEANMQTPFGEDLEFYRGVIVGRRN